MSLFMQSLIVVMLSGLALAASIFNALAVYAVW